MHRAPPIRNVLAVAIVTVVACGAWAVWPTTSGNGRAGPPAAAAAADTAPPTTGSSNSTSTTSMTSSTPTAGQNPVAGEDFPDPSVVATGQAYVAFATNSDGHNVSMLTSPDLVHWTDSGDAMPTLPSWAEPGTIWGPSEIKTASGWVMEVTVGDARRDRQCVFAATSDAVTGPYALQPDPVACEQTASIDPSVVRDRVGNAWLVWKDESDGVGPTTIRAARLDPEATTLVSHPVTLLTSAAAAVTNIEAPSLVQTGNGYLLFFSVGGWRSSSYRTGYATCTALTTTCQTVSTNWLSARDGLDAPGGLEVFAGNDGATYAAFHTGSCRCTQPTRRLNVRPLDLGVSGSRPVLS